jgi:hypothetical protein
MGAAVAHFVAWIGAVLNTASLPSKTFVGLLGLVFVATLAYVIAGPDGVDGESRRDGRIAPPSAGAHPAAQNGSGQLAGSSSQRS